MEQVRKRLTYANVMSSIAAFVAIGGATAFAANQLADKSVGARQLRPGAVTASKLRKNAVIAPKIMAEAVKTGKLANGSVKNGKLGEAAVTADKIAGGAVTGYKIAGDAVTGDKVDESTLGQVPTANTANFATAAESANPVVFARVQSDGSVDSSNSKGLSVAKPSLTTGIYCITVPAFSPKGAQVTPAEEGGTVGKAITAQIKIGGSNCPAPKVEVQVVEITAGTGGAVTAKNAAFFVMLYH